jgi:hypothetical protein
VEASMGLFLAGAIFGAAVGFTIAAILAAKR